MPRTIFLLNADRRLMPLEETGYDSEDLLQALVEDFPALLAGDQFNESAPRRWLLVQREMGVGDAEGAGARWSVDHLFIDQDAIPTLIEVKRSSDTRIRREVVGQLLEYAANGTKYWPVDRIREHFEGRCEREGTAPDQELSEFLGPDEDADAFWGKVADNLQLGRLRLLFVADVIPRELQRIVEFLNEQMSLTEVLAVEIKQFVGEGDQTTLVPRVIGQTVAAIDAKEPRTSQRAEPWSPDSFLAKLQAEGRDVDLPISKTIIEWAKSHGLRWDGGRGTYKASIWPVLDSGACPFSLYEGTGRCVFHVQFNWMGPEFEDVAARRPVADFFNQIPGVELDPGRPYPGIRFALLESGEAQAQLRRALDETLRLLQGP